MRVDDQLDGCPDLILDRHICKFRDAGNIDPILFQITGGQYQGFDGLIDRPGADRLYFRMFVFTNDACNGTCDCGCARVRRKP